MPDWYWFLMTFVFGLLIGSFLNVVIYRWPRGMSLSRPASSCPSCGKPIRPWQNIPVFAYIALRGRCANCKTRIPVRYPAVEFLTGLLSALLWIHFRAPVPYLLHFLFSAIMIAVAFIDIDCQLIPDRFSCGLVACGILSAGVGWTSVSLAGSLVAVAIAVGLALFASLFSLLLGKESLGFGDVKLTAGIGACLGPVSIPFILFAACVLCIISFAMTKALGRNAERMPFGPFLAVSSLAMIFVGDHALSYYSSFFR